MSENLGGTGVGVLPLRRSNRRLATRILRDMVRNDVKDSVPFYGLKRR